MNESADFRYQMLGTNEDNETVRLSADKTTKSLKMIDTNHSNIHNSQGFSISGMFTAVANDGTKAYAFKTPAAATGKYIHLKCREFHATNNRVRADFYEGLESAPTFGTDLTPFNHNRTGTPVASAMQAVKFGIDVVLTGATMIENSLFVNRESRDSNIEWILKPDTWYVRTFTNQSGSAVDIDIYEFWCEE